jgi:hypothetical protein
MGLDYESDGAKKATASKMRSYTSDQSGGTDSGDAREAWDRGYDESLDVEDGKTFSDAIASLRAGRMVHLDVWHKTLADGCISGSGEYGHTIAVVPDYNGEWLVGDPWCTEGYERVPESKLRAAAEEWGRRVYGAAALEADYPTGGDPRDPVVLLIIRRVVKRLMDRSYPGHIAPIDDYPETGGAQPILFTRTIAQPLESDMIDLYSGTGRILVLPEGTKHYESPGGDQSGTIGSGTAYRVVAQDDIDNPSWYLIDGGSPGLMRWVYVSDLTD